MESTTGIVLNENLVYLDNNSQPYLEFEERNEAIEFINSIDNPNISFELMDDLDLVVFERHNKSENILDTHKIKKWWQFWKT